MKKYFFAICGLGVFLLAGCGNNTVIEEETNAEVDTGNEILQEVNNNNQTLEDAIINYIADNYSCNDGSKLFVNYAELGQNNHDFYINVIGQGFYIDERGNLNNSCGFSIPMKVTVYTENGMDYKVTDAIQARDGNEYDKSIREMFSEEAIDRLYNSDYRFLDGRTLLEMAEEYYNIKIIPDEQQTFECKFCDKLWYYQPLENEDGKSNELIYNYVSEDNGKNTIYFDSDGNFKAEGSWDAGEGTRTFGQNENTVIVLNNSIDHVYDRYIITNQDENHLNTILEIIQRM